MILALCINDKNKPNDFPNSKWVKANREYHIVDIKKVLPQEILGVKLAEIELGPDTMPYLFFDLNRFKVHKDNLAALMQMLNEKLKKTVINIDELVLE